jgi:two-component system, sporulation sensor kinase E
MQLNIRKMVAILAGVMIGIFTLWEVVERLLFADSETADLTVFYLARGVSTAIVMSALAVFLMASYRKGYEDQLRRQSEEARRMRVFFENIVQDAGEAIISLDNDNVVRSWNRSAEEIYGYTAREMVGRSIHCLIPPDVLAAGEVERLAESVRKQGYIRNYETRRLRKDGTVVQVRITRSVLRDGEGRVIGTSAIVSDITGEKAMSTRLIQTEKLAAIGQAAASIAHEVRNALAGIAGTIEVLKGSAAWRELPPGFGEEVELQVSRIAHIVNDLLSYARPAALHPQPTDVHRILDRVLSAAAAAPEAGGKHVVREFSGADLVVEGDPARLEQAFTNLVTNAYQAMGSGGILKVATRRSNGSVTILFADTGCGMPPDTLAHAFEPFFTTKVRGTGLGLSIVRTIVEAHRGSIDLKSAPLAGTTVTLTLPVRPSAAQH